jgi:biotin carboxyl carrier protein
VIYEVSEGAETTRVEVREVGEGVYDVTLDGRTVRVDACKSGRTIYSIIEDGRQHEAMVDERGAAGFDVLVAGHLFHLEARDERSRLLAASAAAVVTGPQTVTAQMPGKIVKIEIAVGETVREGQGIVIVEAMKMENEITAHRSGKVAALTIRAGAAVNAGDQICTIE